ncbi:Class I glutamine amidotransferase-like protein [Glarea lozoyensis ATCC 20868]|uniref:Class I glutamine amidotransferase-like protein n=1 Tax=Glarea lozoyensis (strain ATCC 20868 / MF5171) TaxID=1116229 RepID=S3D0S0_GLAL2|nr:Class I glutamine amidotransferase-like protein [Glarea lozoyensis ATCC 20868]EPE31450.1 Class I glutamine amidotransferase-like protein [Glarea lozoyensis ATCC 20868]
MPAPLHIAILDCDIPVPNVYAARNYYSDIFASLLRDAASKSAEFEGLELKFSRYDSMKGEEPSDEELRGLDGIIITGSASSAYDKVPWIEALTALCHKIYTQHPHIRIFGSCFGHQLLSHVLFSPPGQNIVCKDPNGWELGVHPITLSPQFQAHFGPVTSNPERPNELRLQFVHADHVDLHELPEGFVSVGRSSHCGLQGVWKRGRVLTYQGHAEFDRFVNCETLRVFGKVIWEEEFIKRALEQVDQDDDAVWAAGVMLRFFLEDGEGLERTKEMVLERTEASTGSFLRFQMEKMARLLQYVQEMWSSWFSTGWKSKEHIE